MSAEKKWMKLVTSDSETERKFQKIMTDDELRLLFRDWWLKWITSQVERPLSFNYGSYPQFLEDVYIAGFNAGALRGYQKAMERRSRASK